MINKHNNITTFRLCPWKLETAEFHVNTLFNLEKVVHILDVFDSYYSTDIEFRPTI